RHQQRRARTGREGPGEGDPRVRGRDRPDAPAQRAGAARSLSGRRTNVPDYDDQDAEPRPRRAGEGVRIIGAEEAAAALEKGEAAGRRPDDAPRYGDVPERPSGPSTGYRFPLPDSVDPAEAVPRPPVAAPDMPHWTEPPTGE